LADTVDFLVRAKTRKDLGGSSGEMKLHLFISPCKLKLKLHALQQWVWPRSHVADVDEIKETHCFGFAGQQQQAGSSKPSRRLGPHWAVAMVRTVNDIPQSTDLVVSFLEEEYSISQVITWCPTKSGDEAP
jgi:hypothetical protein